MRQLQHMKTTQWHTRNSGCNLLKFLEVALELTKTTATHEEDQTIRKLQTIKLID